MIRRGRVTDIPWFLAGLEIKCLIYSTLHHVVIMAISQLRVLASLKINFDPVAQGA